MSHEKTDAVGPSRRSVLKTLLVTLGAGVLVQATGGVVGFGAQEKPTGGEKSIKMEKSKSEKLKVDKSKASSKTKDTKAKNEKKKTEEPKAQRVK